MSKRFNKPMLSIVVIIYNMLREAPRTFRSLSPSYQRKVKTEDYEVIVVDNGSVSPLPSEILRETPENLRYFFFPDTSSSPARAINFGVSKAEGNYLGIMIDGARIVTPGVVYHALLALSGFPRPIVGTLAFHLGPNIQNLSPLQGYDGRVEDGLLDSIGWPDDGYRLFEIATLAGSSEYGWFLPMAESNCLFMPRTLFDELEGYDERFRSRAGGLVNLDFYHRACNLRETQLIMLLGEGSFHQIHGGVMTNCTAEDAQKNWARYDEEYRKIRGERFSWPTRKPILLGELPDAAVPWVEKSCRAYAQGTPVPRPDPSDPADQP